MRFILLIWLTALVGSNPYAAVIANETPQGEDEIVVVEEEEEPDCD